MGVLLAAAQLDSSADGFGTLHADNLIENMLGFISTAPVVNSLCLTISITFVVTGVLAFDPEALPLGKEQWYEQWLRSDVMYALHWCECVFLALSIYNSIKGLLIGFGVYSGVALYFPDMRAKCRFLMAHIKVLPDLWLFTVLSITFMVLALPFLAARISPVASMCSTIPVLGIVGGYRGLMKVGEWIAAEQHRRGTGTLWSWTRRPNK